MEISTLIGLTSLKRDQAEMISRFLKVNNIKLSTFVVVTKNQLLATDLTSETPKTYVQAGHRIEQQKINPNKFFFALMRGCGTGDLIVIPDPHEFSKDE